MFESGTAVFIGIFLILVKLPRRWLLHLLGYDLALDIAVSILVFVLHFGTFSGLMAATVAGLMTSVATSVLKRCFGFIRGGIHTPGIFALRT